MPYVIWLSTEPCKLQISQEAGLNTSPTSWLAWLPKGRCRQVRKPDSTQVLVDSLR